MVMNKTLTANEAKANFGEVLQIRASRIDDDIGSENVVDGEQFFDELESGYHF